MTPREMLELAARAVGVRLFVWGEKGREKFRLNLAYGSPGDIWNPLKDDGDTQRLAVDMRFIVQVQRTVTHVADENGKHLCSRAHRPHDDDAHAATRYAVTRAAAEVARGAL